MLAPNLVAVVNDNDFGVADITIDQATGTFVRNRPGDAVVLGLARTDGAFGLPEGHGRDDNPGHGRHTHDRDLFSLLLM